MPSVQSQLLRFLLRRTGFLGQEGVRLEDLRRRVNSSARLLRTPRGVSVARVAVGGVPAEWLVPRGIPADRALLYLHGGGFVFCSLDTPRAWPWPAGSWG